MVRIIPLVEFLGTIVSLFYLHIALRGSSTAQLKKPPAFSLESEKDYEEKEEGEESGEDEESFEKCKDLPCFIT